MHSRRIRLIALIGVPAITITVVAAAFAWRAHRVQSDLTSLLKRLPTEDAVVAGVDFSALRKSGFLRDFLASRTAPEAEYTAFVHDTGFNYERDLDYVLASFAPDGEFFLVKGRFDWPRLEGYVFTHGGTCFDHLCRIEGSTPDRKISFFPLTKNVLAMAVAPDDTAAARLQQLGPQGDIDASPQPVWISMSSGALHHSAAALPAGTELFATAMTNANRVSLTFGPATEHANGEIEATLDAICRDAQSAGSLTGQLQALTAMLRNAALQNGKPNGANTLGDLFTSGSFRQAGSHVVGRWRISRALLDTLTPGGNG